jgi:N-acetylmuramoyl-L-alanine amidase
MPVRFIDALIIQMANRCRIILEKIVHAEAQGEGLEGQEYVANVVINRVNDRRFPNAIHPVVFAPNQFSPVTNGAYARAVPSASVKQAVTNVLNGKDNSRGALFFRTIRGATPDSWHERALTRLFDHRNHRFYIS